MGPETALAFFYFDINDNAKQSNGADVNAQGGFYSNALQAAAAACNWRENVDLVQLLLNHGADVNLKGGRYGSVLKAARHDHTKARVCYIACTT